MTLPYESLKARDRRAKMVDRAREYSREKLGFDKCPKCGTNFRVKVVECRDCGYNLSISAVK